ncbi:10689_t:CDS:1, partial [Dentiscutata heterogama]
MTWKSSNEVWWCFKNLDAIMEEEKRTYLQMVTKKVFGRQPTNNQYAIIQAVLYNLFNSEIIKL